MAGRVRILSQKSSTGRVTEIGTATHLTASNMGVQVPTISYLGTAVSLGGNPLHVNLEGFDFSKDVLPDPIVQTVCTDKPEVRHLRTVLAALVMQMGGAVNISASEYNFADSLEVDSFKTDHTDYLTIKVQDK